MRTPGISLEPRRAAFATVAEYRRARADWFAGLSWYHTILSTIRRARRACGPCEP